MPGPVLFSHELFHFHQRQPEQNVKTCREPVGHSHGQEITCRCAGHLAVRAEHLAPPGVCPYSAGQSMPISDGLTTASPRVTRAQASAITTGIAFSSAASP
mgnify:CR=1 FL=1